MKSLKLKIRLVKLPTMSNAKLHIVKLIRDCSEKDLYFSKHLFEDIIENPTSWYEVDIPAKNYPKFTSEINSFSGEFQITNHEEWQREITLLKLGVGEREDYHLAIKSMIDFGLKDKDLILNELLNKLTIEQLKEVMTVIN